MHLYPAFLKKTLMRFIKNKYISHNSVSPHWTDWITDDSLNSSMEMGFRDLYFWEMSLVSRMQTHLHESSNIWEQLVQQFLILRQIL